MSYEDPAFNDDDELPSVSAEPAEASTTTSGMSHVLTDLEHFFYKRQGGQATQSFILMTVTKRYLEALDPANPPEPHEIEQHLLALYNAIVRIENTKAAQKNERHQAAKQLSAWQVAMIMIRLHHAIRIIPRRDKKSDSDLLAVYAAEGPDEGLYISTEDDMREIARRYKPSLTLNEFREIMAAMRETCEIRSETAHRDLIPVNNGIVFYGTESLDMTMNGTEFRFEPKKLHPFDPAIVLTAKTAINYVEDAHEVHITMPDGEQWDIVSWMADLFDQPGDEGLADLMWEVIGAIVRPYVAWDKTAWFYSQSGNNGKGTLCELMRNLLGDGNHMSIPLSEMGREFVLEPLVRVNAIITDENDVGTFIDKGANLKAVVTGDPIQINRKNRVPITFQWSGFMVQCLNELPRMKDKSESNYRRQLFVPFTKSFTGKERKYIKQDYLQRREVLEYVLWYVINRAGGETPGEYYELSKPPATQAALTEYKLTNDPVRAFWDEFSDQFVWDLMPFPFLYDLYKAWFARVSPSGSAVSRMEFVASMMRVLEDDTTWHCPDKNRKIRPGQMMNEPEPLIAEYELKTWYCQTYKGTDIDKLCKPIIQPNYRGVLRKNQAAVAAA